LGPWFRPESDAVLGISHRYALSSFSSLPLELLNVGKDGSSQVVVVYCFRDKAYSSIVLLSIML